jgi:pimeloyl-ACP methyl ester carboxylesterase
MGIMETFLNQWWAGLAMASGLILLGVIGVFLGRSFKRKPIRWISVTLSAAVSGLGALLLVGAVVGISHRAAFYRQHPAPGKLVDIGGYRIHVLAEGESKAPGQPTLVWLPGGYGPSLWIKHLHERFRGDYRSILFDRAGSGWSDPGPMPRTQDLLAEELKRALDAAGEKGPFVVIGHSAGGLQAAQFAYRFPERTAGAVVLDGSPPTLLAVEGRVYWGGPDPMRFFFILATHFGLDVLLPQLHPMRSPNPKVPSIGDETWNLLIEMESRPTALLAMASLTATDNKACYEMVRGREVLGDIPVLSIVQADHTGEKEFVEQAKGYLHINDDQVRVWRAFRRVVHSEFAEMSQRGKLVEAPPKLTHYFPNEDPDFVEKEIREFLGTIK